MTSLRNRTITQTEGRYYVRGASYTQKEGHGITQFICAPLSISMYNNYISIPYIDACSSPFLHITCNSKAKMYYCQICKQYARVSLKEIIRHIRDMHRHFTTPVRCGVAGCPSTASSYESLRQHTYKKHRNELIPEDHVHGDSVPIASLEGNCNLMAGSESSAFAEEESHNDMPASSTPRPSTKSVKLEAARFILKLRDGNRLPQTVTYCILKDIQTMIDSTNDILKRKVTEYLENVNKLSSS